MDLSWRKQSLTNFSDIFPSYTMSRCTAQKMFHFSLWEQGVIHCTCLSTENECFTCNPIFFGKKSNIFTFFSSVTFPSVEFHTFERNLSLSQWHLEAGIWLVALLRIPFRMKHLHLFPWTRLMIFSSSHSKTCLEYSFN